ncbi:hypothetical protein GNZ12_03335 [Paraburkholderia sp. 1N]|uniref:Uncharacterized protein n=1 Tax=Paraburkholderia solitsugae TaxID=2675748 RepID=A0ABX2BLM0_9BURK|nr:hypothetical protein [Paraburkholderia solitsugae]NPT40362.1 hypothetical protein [Paraburkholderia solitsugae]
MPHQRHESNPGGTAAMAASGIEQAAPDVLNIDPGDSEAALIPGIIEGRSVPLPFLPIPY